MDFGKLFSEFGLVGLVIGTLFFILWRMLIWVMAFVKEQQKQQSEERGIWHATIARHNELISKISTSLDEHDKRADERGRYVREEHKQMIETLGRINGYKS